LRLLAPASCVVRVEVFDVQGRSIRTLYDGTAGSSGVRLSWDGTTDHGDRAHAGLYWIRAQSGAVTRESRLILI